jgi:hypothetical protein
MLTPADFRFYYIVEVLWASKLSFAVATSAGTPEALWKSALEDTCRFLSC